MRTFYFLLFGSFFTECKKAKQDWYVGVKLVGSWIFYFANLELLLEADVDHLNKNEMIQML